MKLSPVLYVDAIEPCLDFWMRRLGFTCPVEVPHGDRLGFVILQRDAIEVMLQTWASAADDVPAVANAPRGLSALCYVEVDDFDATRAALEGLEVVIPLRETFYGATEIGVREPGGHVVMFSKHG